jgi:dolichyl-phosphate-mannose-protein mannosyltransferase
MSGIPGEAEELAAAREALARVKTLQKRGIPFDPVVEIAALHEALDGDDLLAAADVAAELEGVCDRVEVAWVELDMLRASLAYLALNVRRRRGTSSPLLAAAVTFQQTWNDRFGDAPTLEARAQMAHRLEARLQEQLTAPPSRPGGAVPTPPASLALAAAAGAAPEPTAADAGTNGPTGPAPPPMVAFLRSRSGVTFLVILAFAALGAYDRLRALGALSLWNDEGQSTLIAFTIAQHGYPVITAQHLINNFEPMYPYLEAASILLLGHSNFAFRLPAALIGIALIPLAYYVGSRLRDRYVGITLAAMTAFSSELIAWSRQARWYILIVLLMAAAFLIVTAWVHTADRRRRLWLLLALLAVGVLTLLTSIGLSLLYLPPAIVAGVVYVLAARWKGIRRFFGFPASPGEGLPPAGSIPYWVRQLALIGIPLLVLVAVLAERNALARDLPAAAQRLIGFTPYPLVWSSNFGTYLEQYYLGVLLLVAVGALFIVFKRDPLELALLTFCIAAFVSVSSLASVTNDIAGGNTSFERHIVPLLFFLFLVAAIGIVELVRIAYRVLSRVPPDLPRMPVARVALFAVLIVALLVLPGIVAPSGLTVHQKASQFQTGQLVVWDPFSLAPVQPSALYQAGQVNDQKAAEYVLGHRSPGDVVGATNPGVPQVYLGAVQYWIRGNALNNTIILVNGQPAFFQTGSLLIATTAQLEGVMFNTTGWLISDAVNHTTIAFPGGMDLVLSKLMTRPNDFSDVSVALYHWNQTSRLGILRTLAKVPSLHNLLGNDTALLNWGATTGVSSSPDRPLLLPLEGYLLAHATNRTLPLATLLNVYNHRADLQAKFPQVLEPTGNNTALIHWAALVTSGTISDPAAPTLQPYAMYYHNNG